jgi:hypothetical protein
VIETGRNRRRVESVDTRVHQSFCSSTGADMMMTVHPIVLEQRRFERNYFFLFFFFFSNVYYKYRSKQNTRHRLSVCLNRIDEKETSPRFPAVGPYLFLPRADPLQTNCQVEMLLNWENGKNEFITTHTHTASLIERERWLGASLWGHL